MTNLIFVSIVIIFTVLSQLILKIGAHTFYYPKNFGMPEIWKMTAHNLTNGYVIGCILLTLLAGLAWLLVIQNMPLSRAYPLMSLNYITIYLLSWMFFSEPFSLPSFIGIVFIMIGTGLLGVR